MAVMWCHVAMVLSQPDLIKPRTETSTISPDYGDQIGHIMAHLDVNKHISNMSQDADTCHYAGGRILL